MGYINDNNIEINGEIFFKCQQKKNRDVGELEIRIW